MVDTMNTGENRLHTYSTDIDPRWIDGNGHVSDRNYTTVFSDAEVAFLDHIGAGRAYRLAKGGHVYTAENHLTFVHEMLPEDRMEVSVGLVDFSEKAIHLSFEMRNARGILCAHHETLILHVRKDAAQRPKVCGFD
ncbi:thioesterase family protein [Rhodobacteraceae bacterium KMM 6894]|nr:thioesterase family protein [Rhodobacteraceae bacterium KMM 6894]